MPSKKAPVQITVRSLLAREPKIKEVARQFARLALAQLSQEEGLNIRQTEQLRRGLATAGEALGWTARTAASDDPISEVTGDVLKLTKGGAKAIEKDLAAELIRKKTEIRELVKTGETTRAMAEIEGQTYPVDVTYSFTARDASGELITKTDTITALNADEVVKAANKVEKNMPSREKLTGLMVIDLKDKQKKLAAMLKEVADFVKSTHGLLREVLGNLQ
jgi:hypothetical protein